MKRFVLISLGIISMSASAVAATPWWEQPTVCRLNPANCYTSMGTGYDSGMWDADAKCWGIKWICSEALTTNTDEPALVGRLDIANGTNINQDFDLNVLNGDCFGVRKTSSDGLKVSVNGHLVHVWCNNILDNVDEIIENGEITYGAEPSCTTLAAEGFVAMQNGKCYGKKYDQNRYYIHCQNNGSVKLIVLNNAPYETSATASYPQTQRDADDIFNRMVRNARIIREGN